MVSKNQLMSLYNTYGQLAEISKQCRDIQQLMEPVKKEIAEMREKCKKVKVGDMLKAREDWFKCEQNVQFMSFICGGITDSCDSIYEEVCAVGRVIEGETERVNKRLAEMEKENETRE